jgi:hypothetical protein
MKTSKYLIILLLFLWTIPSCLVDQETRYDLNDDGKNLVGFEASKTSAATVSDDQEHTFRMKVKIVGPTVTDLKSDITLTVAADPALMAAAAEADTNLIAAVAGTHYRIDNPTVVLKASGNYLGYFDFKMLTVGIVPPLDKNPVLVLKATQATGDPTVTNNGKPLTVNLTYACFSDLAGDYHVHCTITRAISGAVSTYEWDEDIRQTGVGEYRTRYATYAGYVPLGTGTDGVTFTDNCGVATVPEQNLLDYYSNIVVGTAPGTCNSITGTIHLEYSTSTTAAAGNRNGVYDYTRISK